MQATLRLSVLNIPFREATPHNRFIGHERSGAGFVQTRSSPFFITAIRFAFDAERNTRVLNCVGNNGRHLFHAGSNQSVRLKPHGRCIHDCP